MANSSDCALTLAQGFRNCTGTTAQTFGIDPDFRVGYAQTWQLQIQRDLPGALVMTATYLGTKGTHGMQQFLPNTYPIDAANPCPSCLAGFIYRTSNGNSMREAGQIQRGGDCAAALQRASITPMRRQSMTMPRWVGKGMWLPRERAKPCPYRLPCRRRPSRKTG